MNELYASFIAFHKDPLYFTFNVLLPRIPFQFRKLRTTEDKAPIPVYTVIIQFKQLSFRVRWRKEGSSGQSHRFLK